MTRPSLNPKTKTSESGRVCLLCTVMLSVYNHTDHCYTHRHRERPRLRAERSAQDNSDEREGVAPLDEVSTLDDLRSGAV